ncbi:MAG: transposase [Bacteroidota bacterium]|nr:transposase [Bacteroidota bacterium]
MIFEEHHLYHFYNQGNNREKIFFCRDNYLFFLKKINTHLLSYVDVVAWCLMPNHFHFLIYVKALELGVKPSLEVKASLDDTNRRTLNDTIGLMLRSYTRAINIQQNRSGSLFRNPSKAECITKSDGITPSFYNTATGTRLNITVPEKEYPQVCFDYIHNNPVAAGLVNQPEDWEFSSYRDYCGLRNGKMIDKERAKEFVVW